MLYCKVNCATLLNKTWRAQVNAVLYCHVTRLFYLQYSTAQPTARGIVTRLRGGVVNLQSLYFLLNFVEDDQKWYSSKSGILTRWHSNEI